MSRDSRSPEPPEPPTSQEEAPEVEEPRSKFWEGLLGFFIDNKLIVAVLVGLLVMAGLITAPFRWELGGLPRDPTPVDAIPDIGENQQIVFTEWPGRSPRDVEDQISYPLTTALLGISGVRTVRTYSMFGFSSIYVIFEESVDFYWSRSRVLEKLASLPAGMLPPEVAPALGPDATALGQVFWYTLEGRDPATGKVVGGWDQHELRTAQDWTVRYALQGVPGVSEVASVGGYVQEYQVDVDPEALQAYNVGIEAVAAAVKAANLDVGARTMEVNRVEYLVRGVGWITSLEDLQQVVVASRGHTPIRLGDVAKVTLGPAQRRGALDLAGAPAVGGVVVARFGANPLQVIEAVKQKIREIAPSLPKRKLESGGESQITLVPFYDRTQLIHETLGTLSSALRQQILITVLVVLILLGHIGTSFVISAVLPLGVLGAFVAMRYLGVDANIMALSGIAIAIGTMVDMGIVLSEAVVAEMEKDRETPRHILIRRAAGRVAGAILTSTATTVVGFLPVFALTASEGKLFRPLAYTKTFALVAALLLALTVLPALAHVLLRRAEPSERRRRVMRGVIAGLVVTVLILLADDWAPLGVDAGLWKNRLFVATLTGGLLALLQLYLQVYPWLLRRLLGHKVLLMAGVSAIIVAGVLSWLGFDKATSWLPDGAKKSVAAARMRKVFPGLGREFMPPLDEGAYLYMPTTMPHASIGQAQEQLAMMDAAIAAVPEVDSVAGKLGRVESAIDPAPVSMFETVVNYKPEYRVEKDGTRVRQWRPHIKTPRDIFNEVRAAAKIAGVTDAPELMPIAARIVMLQTGMRAPMGLKVRGPSLAAIEKAALDLEKALQEVPAIRMETVVADRVVGKPYLELVIDREAIARHGLSVMAAQGVIQTAIGGMVATRTVEGRERYGVRVRYLRERRDSPDELGRVLVRTPAGHQVPLEQLATIRYVRGPQVIKSEDTFLLAYVVFDKKGDMAEVDVVEQAQAHLNAKIAAGKLQLPEGVSYTFSGSYENQLRSEARLKILVPLALTLIFLLIYLQFRRVSTTLMVFSGAALAMSGGLLLLWAYGQPWMLDFSIAGIDPRQLFRVGPVNMSVAVWVGFIALLGIATDDGVVMATYLHQLFDGKQVPSVKEIRDLVVAAGTRRSRACMMTTATTILALLPVITSTGRGADVMLPMALPALGGMTVELLTLFVVPVLFCAVRERALRRSEKQAVAPELAS